MSPANTPDTPNTTPPVDDDPPPVPPEARARGMLQQRLYPLRLRHLQRSHGRIPRRAQGVAGAAWRGGVGGKGHLSAQSHVMRWAASQKSTLTASLTVRGAPTEEKPFHAPDQ